MKNRGVVIFGSVLAGLQFLAGAAALGDIVGKTTFALFVIVVGAVQVGWAAYQQGVVVPQGDVAAYRNASGQVVAGPAAGATDGTPVMVEPGTVLEANNMRGFSHRDERGAVDTRTIAVIALVLVVIVVLILLL